MKNNHQMRKKLKSSKKLKRLIKIIYYKSIKDSFEKLILDIYSENNNGIMVLGRNNNDIYKYLNSNFKLENQNIIYLKNENIKIRYLTVHKSKGLEEETEKRLLHNEIVKLNDRDKLIMTLRYGLFDKEEMTQKEVAEYLGISQSYISRIEKKIIKKIKMNVG